MTADEIDDVLDLTRGSAERHPPATGDTRTVIFGPHRDAHPPSQLLFLDPGDLTGTGAPPGVGTGRPPVRLHAESIVELGIAGVGTQLHVVGPR